MDRYIGKKLDGRYQVDELIGIGGMANVYKGFDILENKVVALKILRDEFSSSEDFLRRFKNESKAISMLSHVNIVKVFDVSISEKTQYIVMEHIDGITLKEYIVEKGALPWKDVLHFAVQTLMAIQHAHDMGVVHRDVKPQNIMLLEDGSIKVMDFGIARLARSQSRTMTNKAIGSVHYISPEQAKCEHIDARTDIYSIGVILFEMLTGQLPFQADSAVSVAIKQIADNPVKLTEIKDDIPEGLEEITLKAMQKNINKRYQTASSMLVDIDEFKKNPSISFEYKYFQDEEPTKYIDAIKEIKEKEDIDKDSSKNKKTSVKNKKTTMLIGIASASAVFAFIILFSLMSGFNFGNKTFDVPNLTNLNIDEVQNNKEYENFKLKVEEEYSKDFDKGVIFEQFPKDGVKVKKDTEIILKVSIGGEMVKIEDVMNKDYQIAESTLKDLGLQIELVYEFNDKIAKNNVISTDPKAGTEVEIGSKVTITISNGVEIKKALAPDLLGQTQEGAKALLESIGLKLGNVKVVQSEKPINTIVSQD
ncbi:MAG: Stk1 family PASTA domain-containing Ser/Thr kinase, partial [Oscillospiraceae bacterium]